MSSWCCRQDPEANPQKGRDSELKKLTIETLQETLKYLTNFSTNWFFNILIGFLATQKKFLFSLCWKFVRKILCGKFLYQLIGLAWNIGSQLPNGAKWHAQLAQLIMWGKAGKYTRKSPFPPFRWINGIAHKNCQARLIMRYTRNVGSKKCLLRLRGVSAPVAGAIKHTHAIRVRQVEGWGKGTARGRGTTLFNMQNACNFLVYNLKFQRSQRAVLTDTNNRYL